jgi:multimeric flavodoxin WrbA
MNILAISSSPRPGGNTELLVDELLRGAKEKISCDVINDCEIEKLRVCEFNISPCTQCNSCYNNGVCNIKDDMQFLYPKLLRADRLVFASPIYFMAHCAQAKIVIDRCQLFWAKRYILKQHLRKEGAPPRRGVFVSVGATHGPKVFAGAKVTMKWFFDALEMEYWGDLTIEGCDTKGAISQHPTALRQAYELGQNLLV